MKTILCYGDSNTWGAIPRRYFHDIRRYKYHERWTGILSEMLGDDFYIIEEGLRGRTTTIDDHIEGKHKNGFFYLLPCLESHYPIDLVILFLGTNDLKKRFSLSITNIAAGIEKIVLLIKNSKVGINKCSPRIIIVSPPVIKYSNVFKNIFEGGIIKSQKIGEYLKRVAEKYNCIFIDLSDFIEVSNLDGIHLEKKSHQILGEKLYEVIIKLHL